MIIKLTIMFFFIRILNCFSYIIFFLFVVLYMLEYMCKDSVTCNLQIVFNY